MPIRIRCDHCSAKLSVATRKAGMTIRCPGCKNEIIVPAAEAAGSAPPRSRWDAEEEDDDDEGFSMRSPDLDDEGMDLTPMVDVTFLLLIFFMITASFTIKKTLAIPPPDLDETGSQSIIDKKDLEEDSLMVDVDAKGIISIEGEVLSDRSQLEVKLREMSREHDKKEILITLHYLAEHELTVMIVDAAKEAGIQKIRAAIEPGSKPE
ncbi:MAG: biopolymer transporter ExbD [Planctomycetes bacterium]|nr:biopolymer transporter ExbD [Planctomycetota bacterium]